MKRILSVLAVSSALTAIAEKPFDEVFSDSTLRIDYIIGRADNGVAILVDGQTKTAGWAGRRTRLSEMPLEGNGQITVSDPATGEILYKNTFSTLFQEWLGTPEAQEFPESFENTLLVPLPKDDADITLSLNNTRREPIAKLKHRYRRTNELVAKGDATPNEVRTIYTGGDPKDVIDIAILAEGYTLEEGDDFFEHAKTYTDKILSYEPFASNKDKFNFVAVMSPSRQSGVSIPLENVWVDNAFGSHFSTFHSSRYLTAPRVKAMHNALLGVPYEHLIVLINTDRYGGGGIFNTYTTASARNELAPVVVVHEFGHSFGGLADEYFYETEENDIYFTDVEPWEPNITTLVDFDSKWKDMIKPGTPVPTPWKEEKGTRAATMKRAEDAKDKNKTKPVVVGAYEGGGYKAKGVYRPVETCRMRDNYNPTFCPVCERAIARLIEFYTSK